MSSFEPPDNQRAENTLAAYLRGGRLPHAMLVEGGSSFDFAQRIAQAALCSGREERPCGICRDCVKAEKNIHPDLTVYSGGDKARSFHIEAVRQARREAYMKPNESGCKVFILENVQNMTVQAQNALLKIIEEPPADTFFILTCDNKASLLETVLSRVSAFSLCETRADSGPSEAASSGPETGAKRVLDLLLSGSELEALAELAAFERDRAGFASFLTALRDAAAFEMSVLAKNPGGHVNRSGLLRLMKIIDIIDEMERALVQNVSGLLLTVILPAKLNLIKGDRND